MKIRGLFLPAFAELTVPSVSTEQWKCWRIIHLSKTLGISATMTDCNAVFSALLII